MKRKTVLALTAIGLFAASTARAQTCRWLSPYDGNMYSNVTVAPHGGPRLSHPIVSLDFWGTYDSGYPYFDTSHTTLVTDLEDMLGDANFWSRYQQYGGSYTGSLNNSSFFGSWTISGVLSDAAIQQTLEQNDIPGGLKAGIGYPEGDYVVVIPLPPGVSSSRVKAGVADGQGFGYHDAYFSNYLNRTVVYAVINTFSPTSSNESNNTVTISHEVMEAVTDPEYNLNNAPAYLSDHPTNNETTGNGGASPEIGDLCNGITTSFGPASHRVTSQQSWLQNQCRCDGGPTYNGRSFQATSTQTVYVLGTDGNLWLENAPFGSAPPPRTLIDQTAQTFQSYDSHDLFVLGNDGKLWLEHPQSTQPRAEVDAAVVGFQALDLQHVFVLGTDANLWLEQAPFGTAPPARQKVDATVRSFQALGLSQAFVLGRDGNLWLESAPFGNVPPSRQKVDLSVVSFQAVDSSNVFAIDTSGTLWLYQAPFGGAPRRVAVDDTVASIQPVDANTVFVLGTDGKLWLETAPFGSPPPLRVQVDGSVLAYEALDRNTVFVLGTDGNLWLETGPFGFAVPPAGRKLVDQTVAP